MDENKFEKQVKSQMGDFKISPSEAVWNKIESRIQKKKRYLWLLFLLFFLIIGGAAIFMKNGNLTHNQKSLIAKNTSKATTATSKIPVDKSPSVLSQNKDSIYSAVGLPKHHSGALPLKIHLTRRGNVSGQNTKAEVGSHEQKRSLSTKARTKLEIKHEEEVLFIEADQRLALTIAAPILENEGVNENEKSKEAHHVNDIEDSIATIVKKKPPVMIKDSIAIVIIKNKTPNIGKKWVTGLLFNVGISGIGNGFLGLMNSPGFLNYAQTGVVASGVLPKIKAGLGFTIGITEEKSISKKFSFLMGIAFTSLRTSMKVGADTTASFRDTLNPLGNHYNFLELPLSLKLQLGKGSWFWQGGVVISQFLSSNALQLNSNTGSYTTNNFIFNKTQFGLNTSLSFAFLSGRTTFLLGPYFYYDASKIAREGLYTNKHFVVAGLHTQVIFSGKKKH